MALTLTLATTNTTAATSVDTVVTKPASTVDGDLVLVHIHVEDGVTVTPPAGWTLIDSQAHGTVSMQDYAYWKVASGEGASWTWAHSSTWNTGSAYRVTGAPSSSIVDGTPTKNTGTGLTITFPTLTTAQNNSALVCMFGTWEAKTNSGQTSPLVSRLETGWSMIDSGIQVTAGASGAKTVSISAPGTDEWNGIMFAIKDAAEGGGGDPEIALIRGGKLVGGGLTLKGGLVG